MDVLTMVMTNKDQLEAELKTLSLKQLREVIKQNYLATKPGILREKDTTYLVEYILYEAERQMKSATII